MMKATKFLAISAGLTMAVAAASPAFAFDYIRPAKAGSHAVKQANPAFDYIRPAKLGFDYIRPAKLS